MSNERGQWVHAGRQYDADVFVNLETGEKKHIGTETFSDKPKVYDGDPNPLGYLGGQVGKTLIDIITGRRR